MARRMRVMEARKRTSRRGVRKQVSKQVSKQVRKQVRTRVGKKVAKMRTRRSRPRSWQPTMGRHPRNWQPTMGRRPRNWQLTMGRRQRNRQAWAVAGTWISAGFEEDLGLLIKRRRANHLRVRKVRAMAALKRTKKRATWTTRARRETKRKTVILAVRRAARRKVGANRLTNNTASPMKVGVVLAVRVAKRGAETAVRMSPCRQTEKAVDDMTRLICADAWCYIDVHCRRERKRIGRMIGGCL
mmetsp:Transcript_50112/g.80878  ORF Transcript_50112/g.80878 Transcript_50112/m.80878 type:complete len:243 (+) Transcript_50112:994-1722(+)